MPSLFFSIALLLLLLLLLQAVLIHGDAVIRSSKHMFTKDVVWFVPPDVTVMFDAPTVTLARSQVCSM